MSLPSIRTERLWLRPFCDQDVDALHRLWTDPEVRRYLWDDLVISRERAAEVVQSHLASVARHGYGGWSLQVAGPDEIVGFCGFRPFEDGPDIELLYGLLPAYWGRGLATEASRGALNYLWNSTDYPVVLACADRPNSRSLEVMQRLGMRLFQSTASLVIYALERPA